MGVNIRGFIKDVIPRLPKAGKALLGGDDGNGAAQQAKAAEEKKARAEAEAKAAEAAAKAAEAKAKAAEKAADEATLKAEIMKRLGAVAGPFKKAVASKSPSLQRLN